LHDKINAALLKSQTIAQFVKEIYFVYEIDVFNDSSIVDPSKQELYLFNGANTKIIEHLNSLQEQHLYRSRHSIRRTYVDILIHEHLAYNNFELYSGNSQNLPGQPLTLISISRLSE